MGLAGFIQDPATKETKLFHRDATSWVRELNVCVDTAVPIPGELSLLKALVHLRRGAVEGLRKEMHAHQRQQGEPCWGASDEP